MDPHMTPEAEADLKRSGTHRRVLHRGYSVPLGPISSKISKAKKLVTFAKDRTFSRDSGSKERRCEQEHRGNSESLSFVTPERRSSIDSMRPSVPTIAYLSHPGNNNNPTVSVTTCDDYSGNNSNSGNRINSGKNFNKIEPVNLNINMRSDKKQHRQNFSPFKHSDIEEEEDEDENEDEDEDEEFFEAEYHTPNTSNQNIKMGDRILKKTSPDCPQHGRLARVQQQDVNTGLGSPLSSPTTRASRRDSNVSLMPMMVYDVSSTRRNSSPGLWTPEPNFCYNTKPRPLSDEQEEPGQHCIVISCLSAVKQHAKLNANLVEAQTGKTFKYSEGTQTEDIQNTNQIPPPQHNRGRRGSYYEYHKTCLETAEQCHHFQQGRLLEGLERGSEFPVIHLSAPVNNVLPPSTLSKDALGDSIVLQQGVYDEIVCWYPELQESLPSDTRNTIQRNKCQIVIGFKTIQGMEISPEIEERWREWTGALYIYCNISEELGLSHVTFHRKRGKANPSLFTYLVVAQLANVTQNNTLQLLDFVYRMRIRRGNGYISVYKELKKKDNDNNGNYNNTINTAEKEKNGNLLVTLHDLTDLSIT